jgi:hypothetical protein
MKIAIEFLPEEQPIVIGVITRQISHGRAPYPWTLAVAQASASIVLTSPSPICNGTPRWATANPLAVRRTKTVKRYWSPRIPKHEGSGAGVPPAPRTPSRESPGASRTKYLWNGDPNESLSSEGRSLPSHPIHAIRANIFPNSRLHPPRYCFGGILFCERLRENN